MKKKDDFSSDNLTHGATEGKLLLGIQRSSSMPPQNRMYIQHMKKKSIKDENVQNIIKKVKHKTV